MQYLGLIFAVVALEFEILGTKISINIYLNIKLNHIFHPNIEARSKNVNHFNSRIIHN